MIFSNMQEYRKKLSNKYIIYNAFAFKRSDQYAAKFCA